MANRKLTPYIVTAVVAGGAAYFSSKENRGKAKVAYRNMKTRVHSFLKKKSYERSSLTKCGHPHPHDHQDNQMVDEGAMYSVKYYNQVQ